MNQSRALTCGEEVNVSLYYGGDWAYFDLLLPDPAAGWELVLAVTAGDPDFYLADGRQPALADWDLADFSTAATARLGCTSAAEEAETMIAPTVCAGARSRWRLGLCAFCCGDAAVTGGLSCSNQTVSIAVAVSSQERNISELPEDGSATENVTTGISSTFLKDSSEVTTTYQHCC